MIFTSVITFHTKKPVYNQFPLELQKGISKLEKVDEQNDIFLKKRNIIL